jgi:hypothetical protein
MVELDLQTISLFKGATVMGIQVGSFRTWYTLVELLSLANGSVQDYSYTSFEQIHEAMEIMKSGDCENSADILKIKE